MVPLRLVIALTIAASVPGSVAAQPPAASTDPPLTTPTWREPGVPLELAWQLLALPERAVELAFSPFAMAVSGAEQYRLDLRIYDLLRNDAGTILLVPRAKLSTGDGLGVGATLKFKELAGSDAQVGLGGLFLLNSDYELGIDYEQTFPSFEGRALELAVEYELDQDMPYYGIGDETDQRHVLSNRQLRALLDADVTARGATNFVGTLQLGFVRDQLSPGVPGATEISVEPGVMVTLPPGFDATTHYARGGALLSFDTRDTEALTTRGLFAQLNLSGSVAVDDEPLSALRAIASAQYFLQIAPVRRVLVLSGGLGAVTRLRAGDDIPLHDLVTLGRKDHLRGYNRARFRDQFGWWGSAEYRYVAWEYQASGVSLVPAWFVDVGSIGSEFVDLFTSELRYDGGISLRGEHPNHFLFFVELGVSPEGFELGIAIGKDL